MVDIQMNEKGPVESIREWWKERIPLRTALGHPGLTRAVTFLDLVARAVQGDGGVEGSVLAQDLVVMRDHMIHGNASEHGWAMDRDIAAIAAASPKPLPPFSQEK